MKLDATNRRDYLISGDDTTNDASDMGPEKELTIQERVIARLEVHNIKIPEEMANLLKDD